MTFTIGKQYNIHMKCKNLFCVFSRKNGECIKKYVSFDETGMCEHIFYPERLKGMQDSLKECYTKVPKGMEGHHYRREIMLYILNQELRGIKNSSNSKQEKENKSQH